MTKTMKTKREHLPAIWRKIDDRTKHYLQCAQAENTIRAFKSDVAHFLSWGGKIPATREIVAAYLSEHARTHSVATLQRRLASLSKAHRLAEVPSPTRSEFVKMTMRGIMREHRRPLRQAAPLLKNDLMKLLKVIPKDLRGDRDRALLLIGFAGAFRRSELVGIKVEDLAFTKEGVVVSLGKSKTDQEGKGRRVAIPYASKGPCPVKSLMCWLTNSGIMAIGHGPVFQGISKSLICSGRALCDRSVSTLIQGHIEASGFLNDGKRQFSGHSLRAGLVTTAAKRGVSTWKIREQTGHKSDYMVARYCRDADLFNQNVAKALF